MALSWPKFFLLPWCAVNLSRGNTTRNRYIIVSLVSSELYFVWLSWVAGGCCFCTFNRPQVEQGNKNLPRIV